MALPQMTPEQRTAAREKAAAVRKERADLKEHLKDRSLTLADALDHDVLQGMKASELLRALPGVGAVTVDKAMEAFGIDARRRVKGLGARQRRDLIEAFEPASA